jgi:hypothetical protein
MFMSTRSLSLVSLFAAATIVAGCKSDEAVEANASANAGTEDLPLTGEISTDVVVEEHPAGTVAWDVRPGGEVRALVKLKEGQKPEDVQGTVVFKASAEAEPRTVPLVYDRRTQLLVAVGPKLEAELTEMSYTLVISGQPWSGTLHVPVGGTAALVTSARAAAEIKIEPGKRGPNGGVVEVVGEQRVELVSDEGSGEVRVYLLDPEWHVIRYEAHHHVRLGFVAGVSHSIALVPHPGGFFFTGLWSVGMNPSRITMAFSAGAVMHTRLFGFFPGVPFLVGPMAPLFGCRIATSWGPPDISIYTDANVHGRGHAYGHAHAKGQVGGNAFAGHRGGGEGHGSGNGNGGGGKASGGGNGGGAGKATAHAGGGKSGGDSKSAGGGKSGGGSKSGGGGGAKSGGGKSGGGKK